MYIYVCRDIYIIYIFVIIVDFVYFCLKWGGSRNERESLYN